MPQGQLSATYEATIRTILRYSIVLSFVALLTGISFQESAKKLPFSVAPAGIHLESVIQLALVHGHVFMLGVLLFAVTFVLNVIGDVAIRRLQKRLTAT